MNTLCAVRWFVDVIAIALVALASYAMGWRRANRSYWDMLKRASSRTSGEL